MVESDILIKRENVINDPIIKNNDKIGQEMDLNESYHRLQFNLQNNTINTSTRSILNVFMILISIITF